MTDLTDIMNIWTNVAANIECGVDNGKAIPSPLADRRNVTGQVTTETYNSANIAPQTRRC
jgi:hypothetical protein